MARATISTSDLPLDEDQLAEERKEHFEAWLPFCDEWADPGCEYVEPTPEQDFALRIESQQCSDFTLTPHELQQAKTLGQRLMKWCQDLGISGGLRIHQIGPQGRNFAHEVSVVGEVRFRDEAERAEFCERTGLGAEADFVEPLTGVPTECLLMPRNWADAARVLLAGTAWKYDLKARGALANQSAELAMTHGWRGALAWPPLFLLSGVSFWSRHRTLFCYKSRHQRTAAFGSWQEELPSDKDFRSPSQRHRQGALLGLKEARSGDVLIRLDRRRQQAGISKADLARKAGVSRALVSGVFNRTRACSPELLEKMKDILFTRGGTATKQSATKASEGICE